LQPKVKPTPSVNDIWARLRKDIPELPEFSGLSKKAQDTVRVAYDNGKLNRDEAINIAMEDEVSRGSPLRSLETIEAKVGANTARLAKLLGPKLYGDSSSMPSVSQKELFQNAFDAVKESLEKGEISEGDIKIIYDEDTRTIQVIDNGAGMPASVMGKEFLEIAGTKKGTGRASGGFGIAKMQFLFGNKQLEVISLRDGKLSKMVTTGPDLFAALDGTAPPPTIEVSSNPIEILDAEKTLFPDGHGTSVKVTIPESFTDESTGLDRPIDFGVWRLESDKSLTKSPLFADIKVTTKDNRFKSFVEEKEIGKNFPIDKYTPFANVKFAWGSANIYVSDPTPEGGYTPFENLHVLSNGLWQFSNSLKAGAQGPLIPREIYIDIKSNVSTEHPGYPFDLNRQRFSQTAEKDLGQIQSYLAVLYGQEQLGKESAGFGLIRYVNQDGTMSKEEDIRPSIPSKTPTLPKINPKDKVEVKDGVMYVNGKEAPEITPDDIKNVSIDVNALTIPQSSIDPTKVLFHNNLQDPNTDQTLYDVAADKFGAARVNKYLYGVGNTFKRLRDALAQSSSDYSGLDEEGVGISFDNEYVGVNIRVPFRGMFINPAYTKMRGNPAEIAVSMLGTMQHELAHFKERNHGADFASEMQKVITLLETSDAFDMFALKKYFVKHIKDNQDIFDFLSKEFIDGNFKPIGNRFKDSSYEQVRDEGASVAMETVSRPRARGPRVSGGSGKSAKRTGSVGVPARVPSQTAARGANQANAVSLAAVQSGFSPKPGGTSRQMADSVWSGILKFRTKFADKGATVFDNISREFNNGVHSALKGAQVEAGYRQADSSDQIVPMFYRLGAIARDAATKLWKVVEKKDIKPPAEIVNLAKTYAKDNNLSFDEAWKQLSDIFQAGREKAFRDHNATRAKGEDAMPRHMKDADVDRLYPLYESDPTVKEMKKVMDAIRFDLIDNMMDVGRIPKELADEWKLATNYIPFDRQLPIDVKPRTPQKRVGRGIAQLGKLPELVDAQIVNLPPKNVLENYLEMTGWMVEQVIRTDATVRTLRALEDIGQAKLLGTRQKPRNDADRIVSAYIKGEERFFEVDSPYHAVAFRDDMPPTLGIFRAFQRFSQVLRHAITAVPTFTAAQLPQDIQRAITYSGVKDPLALTTKVLGNFKEYLALALKGKLAEAATELGEFGVIGGVDFHKNDPAAKFLDDMGVRIRPLLGSKRFAKLLNRLEAVALASDIAMRKAIYDQTLEETQNDELLALTRAREIINFRRFGAGDKLGLLHIATQTVPFYNAYIQGTDVLYRALTGKNAVSGLARNAALKQFWKNAGYIMAASTAYAFLMADDEEYENMDLRERDRTWVIGNGIGLPVASELGVLFKAIPERMVEYYRKQGTPDEAVAMEAIISHFKTGIVSEYLGRAVPFPAAIKPLMESYANISFLTGRELEGISQKNRDPSERTTSRTSELAKSIAQFTADNSRGEIQISPIMIDNVLQGYFGTTAALVMALTDQALNPDKADRPLHQIVGATAFAYDPVGTRRITEFYDLREKVVRSQNTLNRLITEDPNRAAEYYERNAERLAVYKMVNSTLEQLQKTREYKNWLDTEAAAETMSSEERMKMKQEVQAYEQQLVGWVREAKNTMNL
jgi:hypothetical protein